MVRRYYGGMQDSLSAVPPWLWEKDSGRQLVGTEEQKHGGCLLRLHDMADITRAARRQCHCGQLPRPRPRPLPPEGACACISSRRAWWTRGRPPRRPVLERFLANAPTQLAGRVLLRAPALTPLHTAPSHA